jgi:hypothetical protein
VKQEEDEIFNQKETETREEEGIVLCNGSTARVSLSQFHCLFLHQETPFFLWILLYKAEGLL